MRRRKYEDVACFQVGNHWLGEDIGKFADRSLQVEIYTASRGVVIVEALTQLDVVAV